MFQPRLWVGALALAFFCTGVLCGDDPKKDETKSKGQLPPGWRQLDLKEDQKQKIYKVQAEYRGQIETLEKQIKALQAKERADMVKVLTTEQRTRLREITEGNVPGDSPKGEATSKPPEKKPDEKKPDTKKP